MKKHKERQYQRIINKKQVYNGLHPGLKQHSLIVFPLNEITLSWYQQLATNWKYVLRGKELKLLSLDLRTRQERQRGFKNLKHSKPSRKEKAERLSIIFHSDYEWITIKDGLIFLACLLPTWSRGHEPNSVSRVCKWNSSGKTCIMHSIK